HRRRRRTAAAAAPPPPPHRRRRTAAAAPPPPRLARCLLARAPSRDLGRFSTGCGGQSSKIAGCGLARAFRSAFRLPAVSVFWHCAVRRLRISACHGRVIIGRASRGFWEDSA
ncbi:hypothetical protein, partial [Actinoplanes lobatus]|uniref:hypothetical protein n=1 Tax=Actinoplanes lobatus TaxID=113568 RepID=UPI0019414561